jgi:hypothetical protein
MMAPHPKTHHFFRNRFIFAMSSAISAIVSWTIFALDIPNDDKSTKVLEFCAAGLFTKALFDCLAPEVKKAGETIGSLFYRSVEQRAGKTTALLGPTQPISTLATTPTSQTPGQSV